MLNSSSSYNNRTGFSGAVEYIAIGWALAGGVLLLCVVIINVISIIGGIFWKPLPGDFELTEMGVAIVAFSFLPYCQLTGANVTADIFTARASPYWISRFQLIAAILAIGFAFLLIWRMSAGMISQRQYGTTTTILQIPIWWAYIPSLASLLLLFVTAIQTMLDNIGPALQKSD